MRAGGPHLSIFKIHSKILKMDTCTKWKWLNTTALKSKESRPSKQTQNNERNNNNALLFQLLWVKGQRSKVNSKQQTANSTAHNCNHFNEERSIIIQQ